VLLLEGVTAKAGADMETVGTGEADGEDGAGDRDDDDDAWDDEE
jgi:hypothetical protein